MSKDLVPDMIEFNFDNTYAKLPEIMATKLAPIPVKNPKLIIFNESLAKELGIHFSKNENELAKLFSGNELPSGSEPLAQAYCGHQFGHFVMLGDGRAIVLGEHITPGKKRFDIQFKGSGKTPYSRMGDGRAALGPMLREYLISEAMHALHIPTTRSLAVVTTGEEILRETKLKGAILTRVAASHIRIGTFQYVAAKKDVKMLSTLVDYTIQRHFPDLLKVTNRSIALLKRVTDLQVKLICDWMRVSFIHGVMNTDNVSIAGETIDFGPCAFMDQYDPKTVFSSIDHYGRYSFGNQPVIIQWNLARFAESLIPLLDSDEEKAIRIGEEHIDSFDNLFANHFHEMMKQKLGLITNETDDKILIEKILSLMLKNQSDYTNTFRYLINGKLPQEKLLNDPEFLEWEKVWKKRIETNQNKESAMEMMMKTNPAYIPRNHKVEEAIQYYEKGEDASFKKLLRVLQHPYQEDVDLTDYQKPSSPSEKVYKTFCGT